MGTQKKSAKKGKIWRAKRQKYAADSVTGKGQRQRIWTDIETETFATVLADPDPDFFTFPFLTRRE